VSTSKWRDWLVAGLSERCALCDTGAYGVALCPYCARTLTAVAAPCPVCALPTTTGFCAHPRRWQLHSLRAPFVYAGSARRLVGRLKFDRQRWLGQLLGELMQPSIGDLNAFDLCFPVPLHRRRLAQRGFNQALEIAHGALPGIPTASGLHRVIDTPPQSQLGAQQRRRNLVGCFRLTRSVDRCRVLLIDDVVTTGSTLNALAAQLREQGATEVHGLAFARAISAHSVSV
jgi:ComF family protein